MLKRKYCFHNSCTTLKLWLFPAAVGAQNVVTLSEEASSHQRNGALHAGETLPVPLTVLKGDVLGPCQTCTHQRSLKLALFWWVKSKKPWCRFLGIKVAEAFEAIVFPGCEALPWQLLSTANAQETLAMPGFLLIGHPLLWWPGDDKMTRMNLACFPFLVVSFICDKRLHCTMPPPLYLLTSAALVCILFLKTGNAEVAWESRSRASCFPCIPFCGSLVQGTGKRMQYSIF